MEKKLVIAIALSFLVILIWSGLQPKPAIVKPPVAPIQPAPEIKPVVLQELPATPFSLDIFELNFVDSQAALKEAAFKSYFNDKLFLKNAFFYGEPNWTFTKEKTPESNLRFVYQDQQKKISKDFIFHKSSYIIDLEISVSNISSKTQDLDIPFILGTLAYNHDPTQSQYLDVAIGQSEKIQHFNGRKDMTIVEAKFVAIRNRYFCTIIEPISNKFPVFIKKIDNQDSETGFKIPTVTLAPNQIWREKFRIYLGPQDLKQLDQINPAWTGIINYGSFDIISQMLLTLLEFLYRLVHNFGLAIIMLSVLIYFLLFPLTLKQMRSMKEMQQLQPRIEELKKGYKDNPQKLNKEIMELYKVHKVNPLGGCLPVVLQIPIFFALYQALVRTIALKGAKFLWIKDLSLPDHLFTLPVTLPFIGNAFNILPILMAIGMFIQQKTTTVSSAGMSSEQQKIMLILFPVMFGFIFYNMPSGLVLYWFTNSLFTLIYQIRINRSKT